MSLKERTYSILIVSAADRFTSAFADLLPATRYSQVHTAASISTAKRMLHDKVVEYGVFTLPKPTSKPTLIHALSWMESARERLRQFEKKSLSIKEKMAEIRLVNQAKWILISELKMNEPDAHRYIEKQAMDRCITKQIIAEEIIKTYT